MDSLFFWKHLSVADPASFFQNQRDENWEAAVRGCNTDLTFVSKGGVVTSAQQAVVLPLSPLLTSLVGSSQCCDCPQHLPTLILPDSDNETVHSLLQLVYTGSVIVKSNENKGIMELIKELGLRIREDRISEEWIHQRSTVDWEDQTSPVEDIQQVGSDSRSEPYGDELLGDTIHGELVDTRAESQINRPEGETSGEEEVGFDGARGEMLDVENGSNENEQSNSQAFACVNCNKTFSEEKVTTYILHERNCKERSSDETANSPSQDFKSYQISVPNFYGSSLQNRVGVYHFADNETENIIDTIDMDVGARVKNEGNKGDEEERSWKKVDVCIICKHNLESLDLADRGAHFYAHFKRQLISWLDGMLQVYFCDPKKCPQCDVKFGSKKALCKHVGTAHNLYQTFLNRFSEENKDLFQDEALTKRIDTSTSSTSNTKAMSAKARSIVKHTPDFNGNIPKKKGGKLKQVKIKIPAKEISTEITAPELHGSIDDFACQLCNKTFSKGGQLLQHTCGHFKKELKQGYPNIFSVKGGEKVTCPVCDKGPMKKAVLLIHIGATHREVIKYAPWVKTDFKKDKQQASKKVDESDSTWVNSIDVKVERKSEKGKAKPKKRKLGRIKKLSTQSEFQDTHEIENNIPNSEHESPMKRRKHSSRPVFAQAPRNARNTMDQSNTTAESGDNSNLPECSTDRTPSVVDQDTASVLVTWKDSDADTLVMDSTLLLDPADLSELVASAKLALNKQGL